MNDEIKERLDGILAGQERTAAAERLSRHERLSAEIETLLTFQSLCRETIRPVMQEFVDLLASRNVKAEIVKTEEDLTEDMPVNVASMRLRVLTNPKLTKRAFDVPGFAVFCNKRHGTVRFHQSTIGRNVPGSQQARDVGDAVFRDVSSDLLQGKIAAFLTALYT